MRAMQVGYSAFRLATHSYAHLLGGRSTALSADGVEEYLDHYLDLSMVRDDVKRHVANWLRGRPRWTANFLEIYIMREASKKGSSRTRGQLTDMNGKLIDSLDRYLNVMTCEEKETVRRESWAAGNSSAYYDITKIMSKVPCGNDGKKEENASLKDGQRNLEVAICNYAVGTRPTILEESTSKRLIGAGVATVCLVDEEPPCVSGYIDEPIVVQAALNFFCLEKLLRDNLANQEQQGQGQAFERLLLPSLLRDTNKFRSICDTQLGDDAETLKDFSLFFQSSECPRLIQE